jgi:uncharacterized protein
MPTNLRLLGVHGKNAPTKKSKTVTASDFSIGGLIGFFERKYLQAFQVHNPTEQQEIFGNNINSNWYGNDVMKSFWDNLAGQQGSMYIKSHVGYTGSAIDGVVAFTNVNDRNGVPAQTLKLESAYKTVLDYGVSGNRTARKIVNGVRYATTINGIIGASDVSGVVASVSGIKLGDLIVFHATGGTPADITKKVTNIDESTNTVFWTGTFSGGATTGANGDGVDIPGFQIKTYRKSITGIEVEVETALGLVFCTLEPEVVDYYVQNVHANNKWLKITDLSSASVLLNSWPPNDSTTVYLTSGADGTAPTTATHWAIDLVAFNGLPIRLLANVETTLVATQKAGETYCKGRTDTPFWITVLQKDMSQSQLITIGSGYQRSDDVFQVNVADWIGITDPFNNSPIAPDRYIPNAGASMGAWIRTIALLGIHYIPAVDQITLLGINSLANTNLGVVSDEQRTILAEYGINLIQFVSGGGYRIRNFFTPSTSIDFQFANGLMMRNFIKISSEDSLQSSENTPNSFNRIKEDRDAIKNFLYKLWFKGSTNNAPEGETFGIQENPDGSLTTPEDHFEVVADAINNPLTSINAGQRNIQVFFTFPTPAGSIEIDVGIMLR